MIEHDFLAAIAAAGLTPPRAILADGKIHRFRENGKDRKRSAWYAFHADTMTGVFGSWRTGARVVWHAQDGRAHEDPAARERIQAEQQRREAEVRKRRRRGAKRAHAMWSRARAADPAHPYLITKKVGPHGIRQLGRLLLVPLRGMDRRFHGLQRIWPSGTKRFTVGTDVTAHFHVLGDKITDRVVVCEGFATAASVHEALNVPVVVAFSAGNLRPVAEAFRDRFGTGLDITIAADIDRRGMQDATEAAEAVLGRLVVPMFRPGEEATDFNDLAALAGPDAVRAAFREAAEPKADGWPEPIPLELPQSDRLPIDGLPAVHRQQAVSVSRSTQSPQGYERDARAGGGLDGASRSVRYGRSFGMGRGGDPTDRDPG